MLGFLRKMIKTPEALTPADAQALRDAFEAKHAAVDEVFGAERQQVGNSTAEGKGKARKP